LHCVQAISRTRTIAALYAARHRGIPIETAPADVERVRLSSLRCRRFEAYSNQRSWSRMDHVAYMPDQDVAAVPAEDDTFAFEMLLALQPKTRPVDPVTWKHRYATTSVSGQAHLSALIWPLSYNQLEG
jgi:hypothetical protein